MKVRGVLVHVTKEFQTTGLTLKYKVGYKNGAANNDCSNFDDDTELESKYSLYGGAFNCD